MLGFPFDSNVTYDEQGNPQYDRGVTSEPLREMIGKLFTSGVMPNPSSNLQVTAGTDGMTVIVNSGFAVLNGGLAKEDNTRVLSVVASDNNYDRIDTVVVRWDENDDKRTADLHIVQGTPAKEPVRPELTRNSSVYEIGLADVFVTKGVATIKDDKITDTRYESSRCGIVSSVSEWDTTTIYNQIQADLKGFKENEQEEILDWFNEIKGKLGEDEAVNLQMEIDDIKASISKSALVDMFYPVGSVYVTSNSEFNPNTEFGGTWEQIKDRFILAAGDTYKGGQVGGSATHTLTIDEMPSHAHNVTIANDMNYPVVAGSRSSYAISGASVWTDASVKYGGDFWVMANSNGGDKPHSIMNPYIVKYVWERVN